MRQGIAVYGGTFDPVHNGHLSIAEAVLSAFAMDRVLFVPAFVPPHKRGQEITSPFHRMAMLALATAGSERMRVSSLELEAPSRPYTIETLQALGREWPGARMFFLMGADSFRDVTSWREYERIMTEYSVIVCSRPGYLEGADPVSHLAPELRRLAVDLRGRRRPSAAEIEGGRIFLTDYVSVDVSATDIRDCVEKGLPVDHLVPAPVAAYIGKYGLYKK